MVTSSGVGQPGKRALYQTMSDSIGKAMSGGGIVSNSVGVTPSGNTQLFIPQEMKLVDGNNTNSVGGKKLPITQQQPRS